MSHLSCPLHSEMWTIKFLFKQIFFKLNKSVILYGKKQTNKPELKLIVVYVSLLKRKGNCAILRYTLIHSMIKNKPKKKSTIFTKRERVKKSNANKIQFAQSNKLEFIYFCR